MVTRTGRTKTGGHDNRRTQGKVDIRTGDKKDMWEGNWMDTRAGRYKVRWTQGQADTRTCEHKDR